MRWRFIGASQIAERVAVSHAVSLAQPPQGWRLDRPEAGAGVVFDILTHDADLLRFLPQGEPRRIQCSVAQAGLGRGEVEDSAMSVVEFEGGVPAQMHQPFVASHAQSPLHVLGTEASLYAEGSLTQSGESALWLRDVQGERRLTWQPADLHEVGLRAVVRACEGLGEPLATGLDGARSLAVALAALTSARIGRRVDIV